MRRYRYGDPSKFSFKKYSTYAYVFLAWNLLGYMIYKVWYKKKEETTPQWETMSSSAYLKLKAPSLLYIVSVSRIQWLELSKYAIGTVVVCPFMVG